MSNSSLISILDDSRQVLVRDISFFSLKLVDPDVQNALFAMVE